MADALGWHHGGALGDSRFADSLRRAEAVRGVNALEEGEVLGLVGESGSGKSATALAILGLLGPAAQVAGQILWRGGEASAAASRPAAAAAEAMRRLRGREIAMIFQEPMTALNPVMTIGRQVAESARRILRRGRDERQAKGDCRAGSGCDSRRRAALRRLSAPVLRRAEAADPDRHGADQQAAAC